MREDQPLGHLHHPLLNAPPVLERSFQRRYEIARHVQTALLAVFAKREVEGGVPLTPCAGGARRPGAGLGDRGQRAPRDRPPLLDLLQ